jgi:hypothetical protein
VKFKGNVSVERGFATGLREIREVGDNTLANVETTELFKMNG